MERFYRGALAHCLGYMAPQLFKRLLTDYGSCEMAYKYGLKAELARLIKQAQLKHRSQSDSYKALPLSLAKKYDADLPQALQHYCQEKQVRLLIPKDEEYPELLKELYDPPAALYVKGQYLAQGPNVAIVGSRKASGNGLAVARKFAQVLAGRGLGIVSGGAYGIDSAAHTGALEARGRTVVVLGGGLEHLYPAGHYNMFRRVLDKGSLVTEYAPWEGVQRYYFPHRNRIIVGLCPGVLIVEAALKSGAMITAGAAVAENRELYVIPGSILQPTCQGTNSLIKDGARLVDSPEEILRDYLGKAGPEDEGGANSLFPAVGKGLNQSHRRALELINTRPGIKLEEIVLNLGLTLNSVSCILLELQLAGVIRQEANNSYRAI